MAQKNKKTRPSLLTRSSKSTRRRTTSPLEGFSTAGNQEPKRWEASSAATFLGRPGDTGPTKGRPELSTLARIAEALSVDVADPFRGQGNQPCARACGSGPLLWRLSKQAFTSFASLG